MFRLLITPVYNVYNCFLRKHAALDPTYQIFLEKTSYKQKTLAIYFWIIVMVYARKTHAIQMNMKFFLI